VLTIQLAPDSGGLSIPTPRSRASSLVDIRVLDHIIVAGGDTTGESEARNDLT
jgi:hypothetical protein